MGLPIFPTVFVLYPAVFKIFSIILQVVDFPLVPVIEIIKFFLQSFFGKFLAIGIIWSFSFQILAEIRHLLMDLGYGFELKTSKISGLIVIFGSFILTVFIYIIGS